MQHFKIRCSAIGEIMAGTVGLTEAQTKKVREYSERKIKGDKPLTELMEKELSELLYIQDNPELPQSAKTYCLNWIKEQLYQRRKDFSSKYTQKGIEMESAAIDFCSEILGWGMVQKNEIRFTHDEFIEGEPDVILADSVEDIKCSWDCFTFPLFYTKADSSYEWQLQGYMYLTGRKKAGVNYCLMDAPENIVDLEALKYARSLGENEVSLDTWQEVYDKMAYSGFDSKLRHKRFEVTYNHELIIAVCTRVVMCRNYIAEVLATIKADELLTINKAA